MLLSVMYLILNCLKVIGNLGFSNFMLEIFMKLFPRLVNNSLPMNLLSEDVKQINSISILKKVLIKIPSMLPYHLIVKSIY